MEKVWTNLQQQIDESPTFRNKSKHLWKCSYQCELKALKSTNGEILEETENAKSRLLSLQKEFGEAKLENAKLKEKLQVNRDKMVRLIRINNTAMAEDNGTAKHLQECKPEERGSEIK